MKLLKPAGLAVLAGMALAAPVEAACTWQISGQIVRTDEIQLADGVLSKPGAPLQVMAIARWSAGCPGGQCQWNAANWLPTTSDGDGNFTITSLLIPNPSCQMPRDFIVLYRSPALGVGHWQTVDMVSNRQGPDQLHGPLPGTPFMHEVSLGQLKADDLGLPPGAQLPPENDPPDPVAAPSGAPLPSGTGGPPPGQAGTNPGAIPGSGNNPSGPNLPTGTMQQDPCALLRSTAIGQADFAFAPHPSSGGQGVSPDGRVGIARRQNAAGVAMSRRINATFQVANTGERDFTGHNDACPVTVEVRYNEGPGPYDDPSNWHVYDADMPTVLRVPGRFITLQGTLRGTGNDTAADWNEDYRLVAVEVVLDVANSVSEANEADNSAGLYCYDAVAAEFVDNQQCEDAAGDGG